MNHLPSILYFIIILGIMVLVHELGHFIVAKLCGIRVETFSIGFGKRLFGFRRGDTDYRVSALPLGGYVKMSGDNPGEHTIVFAMLGETLLDLTGTDPGVEQEFDAIRLDVDAVAVAAGLEGDDLHEDIVPDVALAWEAAWTMVRLWIQWWRPNQPEGDKRGRRP